MGLYENILIITLGGLVNHILIYKKLGSFYGLIGYAILGLLMASTGTGTIQSSVGIFVMVSSFLILIIEFIEYRTGKYNYSIAMNKK